ncbi:plasminogen-binding N-terminal domain-containing protein [Campylobacter sp. LR286c]|uniref:plasminogen-binding N-terminal domain-containing protein n=1 Tax=Campylobacter sp. LR286c TaxID=2593545 RepID=UPI001238359B|nr:plasminogen-binding N-terminal domain-containing protein [Campylobacter sp. LR286c]KAA6226672.1 exporting protein [Campylobacter sp. LR286c]
MLKILIFFLCLSTTLFAEFNLKPTTSTLLKVDDIYGYIKDDSNFIIGSSGVIIHSFGDSKSIVARARVIQKINGVAKLEFSVFDALEQSALPLPNILPEEGDEVILNFLYDRAVIIAPDEEIYNYIHLNNQELYFTHIDILGAQLIRTSVLSPKRSDFRKFCANNTTGIVIFALQEKAKYVDCQDFVVLYESQIPKTSSIQVPFYSRIGGYKSGILDFTSEQISNFFNYYETLIDLYSVRKKNE